MSDQERLRARQEAVTTSARAQASANRARFWAGLNRYLAVETEHERKLAVEERSQTPPAPQRPTQEKKDDDRRSA